MPEPLFECSKFGVRLLFRNAIRYDDIFIHGGENDYTMQTIHACN